MNARALPIAGLRSIAERFDHVLLDQWGTLHEGKSAYPAAYQCVVRLRQAGKRVVVLSNSGKRADPNRNRLPMLCANPDLVMFGAGGLRPAPGALAALYQSLGGPVHFVGKPHAPMFTAALERLGNPAPERVLVIGDSLDHDVAGGLAAGMLTLLITSGAHREIFATAADPQHALRALAGSGLRMPHWTLKHLAW
jgi:ribonucleotide monophosphatase NagD (HAD superfamily)